ncbi:MAG: PAS domain-containing protein [Pseudomonadota bacterium]
MMAPVTSRDVRGFVMGVIQLSEVKAVVAGMTEPERLALLDSYSPDTLVDDPELVAITQFAAKLAGTPTALVSLVEADRQRFLAREGLEATETPRSQSFCQYAMAMADVMEVVDARDDPRFADNGLVTGPPQIRFYAGAPLIGEEGESLGALCVLSPDPRPGGLSELQREGLTVLAAAVMRRMRDRRTHLARLKSDARFEALGDAIPQMAWSTLADGMVDYFNLRWEEFTGVPAERHYGTGWLKAVHPDDHEAAVAAWQAAVAEGTPYEVEYRMLRNDGEWRWTLARGLPVRDAKGAIERWFGTNTDIHERRTDSESRELLTRELSHRIKNIFTLVAGLLHLEAKSNPALSKSVGTVNGRIDALARAHDHVRPDRIQRGEATQLVSLLGDLFAPYDLSGENRVRIQGDDLVIAEEAVSPLALLFHELATNAAKYGALSDPGGTIDLTIKVIDGTTCFDWREQGGPAADQSGNAATGFGNTLIAMAVERQLRGTIERTWEAGGLHARIEVPTGRLAP